MLLQREGKCSGLVGKGITEGELIEEVKIWREKRGGLSIDLSNREGKGKKKKFLETERKGE